jgi:hypothetical protein
MRMGVWCNTLGLVIAVTCMGIVMPWKNDKILNGVTYECVQYLTSSNYASPRENVDFHYNKYAVLIDKIACEDILDIEAKKKKYLTKNSTATNQGGIKNRHHLLLL